MNPRIPYSPPATPITTLSLTTSGASVIPYAADASATLVFHTNRPLLASSASKCASTVAMNNVSPRIATPRFTDPAAAEPAGRRTIVIRPENPPHFCVQRDYVVGRLRHVHD